MNWGHGTGMEAQQQREIREISKRWHCFFFHCGFVKTLFLSSRQLQTEADADLHSSGLTERCEADYLRVCALCRAFVAVFHILAGEEGREKMDTDLKVNDFTHTQLFNDIKDLFCSVSDWHSRARGRSRALSAQRCFCGVFFYSFLAEGQILY